MDCGNSVIAQKLYKTLCDFELVRIFYIDKHLFAIIFALFCDIDKLLFLITNNAIRKLNWLCLIAAHCINAERLIKEHVSH